MGNSGHEQKRDHPTTQETAVREYMNDRELATVLAALRY
jgi:hypothetical protein